MNLKKLTTYKVIGIMSGTSRDGVDFCYAQFQYELSRWKFKIIAAKTVEYSPDELKIIDTAFQSNINEMDQFSEQYAHVLVKKLNSFIEESGAEPNLICSHGHTIFHAPEKGITIQIGNGQIIADSCRIPTVADFRTLDVTLGGQGAPLVPIGDALLFPQFDACLNLGGFSNISMDRGGERIAFDISPANLPLNMIVERELGMLYDKGGEIARTGTVNKTLLEKLNGLEYYSRNPPKSLGQEWLLKEFMSLVDDQELETKDALATITEHVAHQIHLVFEKFKVTSCLITGGGARNTFLMELLTSNRNVNISIPEESLIDFKEALVFGLLGILRVRDENNTLKSVTGATKNSSGGKLFIPR